jgi:molecular chaperone GrpE
LSKHGEERVRASRTHGDDRDPLSDVTQRGDDAPGDDGGPEAEGAPDGDSAPQRNGAAGAPAVVTAEPDERYLRLAADFENFRRRKNQELADRSRYASEDAAVALLPVLDNLRRAVAHAAEAGTAEFFVAGLELVVREFEAALQKLGVTPIESEGRPFDPSLHEAIGGHESESVDVDTVVDEVQRGYRLHDRVLRPALVRVAHPSAAVGGE